jgi:hypothetical protein
MIVISERASTEGRDSGIIIVGDSHKKNAVNSLKSPANDRYNIYIRKVWEDEELS